MKYLQSDPMFFGGGIGKDNPLCCSSKCGHTKFSFKGGVWRCASCNSVAIPGDLKVIDRSSFEKLMKSLCPHLYEGLNNPDTRGFQMLGGLDIGPGWRHLLFDTSLRLEQLMGSSGQKTRAAQVKEKFGRLTIYLDGATEEMRILLADAEKTSQTICEECGEPGTTDTEGRWWRLTLCEAHHKARLEHGVTWRRR